MPALVTGLLVLLHLLHLLRQGVNFLPVLRRSLLRTLCCRLSALSGLLRALRGRKCLVGRALCLLHILSRGTAAQQ